MLWTLEGRSSAMALLEAVPAAATATSENRRYQRVKIDLLGRYMLEDRREFPCQVIDMSPGGLAMIAPQCGRLGERVIAYIDHVGRLEGSITRILPSGFSMTIAASQRKRDKLAAQLTWLANRHILDLPEDRRHQRVANRDQMVTLTMADGSQQQCAILDLSVSGVAVVSRSGRRWGAWCRSARHRGGWCATSKTALSSSRGSRTRTCSRRR